ncbi:hypothetical protein NKI09_17600 [Mesorhizobium sp. M0757]|uniref:hypothetical protein n=1 Tax=Mesorhizobium sp. M0757 TaxID=2956993 RepID=UPI0033368CC9
MMSSLQSLPLATQRRPAVHSSSQTVVSRYRPPQQAPSSRFGAAAAAAIITLGAISIAPAAAKTATQIVTPVDYHRSNIDRNADLSAQVISYGFLETDWDGAGGVTPSSETVANALSFIDLLPLGSIPTGAMVEGTGEVGFYWKKPGTYIDITFDQSNIVYYAKVPHPDSNEPMVVKGRSKFNGASLPKDLLTAISLA